MYGERWRFIAGPPRSRSRPPPEGSRPSRRTASRRPRGLPARRRARSPPWSPSRTES
uniref:Uncharacterized protein n=1 Tax=uncultured marine virus TaxID=186617 RepID=A0A0F7L3E8_9VIRU|nr:hypothetical protein [uncultured marine virus]